MLGGKFIKYFVATKIFHIQIYQSTDSFVLVMEKVSTSRILESIESRETDPENLESILNQLMAAEEAGKTSGVTTSYISQIWYWKGEASSPGQKLFCYEKGVLFGKKAVTSNPEEAMAHFWLGTNLGLMGQEKGILSSLFLLPEIESHLRKSLALDESYFYGAPHRAMGWLLHSIPPWPLSSGDNKKAMYHLEKALSFGNEFPMNYLYAGEIYISLGKKKEAKEILTQLVDRPDDPKHANENAPMIQKAKNLLKQL